MTSSGAMWPRELPMFPLGSVVLPGVALPLHVFEPRYRALVMTCLTSDRLFGSVLIERGSEVGGGDLRANSGTLVRIVDAEENADGQWAIMVVGVERLRVVQWLEDDPFPRCVADVWPDEDADENTKSLLDRTLARTMVVAQRKGFLTDPATPLQLDPNPHLASFQLTAISPLGPLDRLAALKATGPNQRLEFLLASLEEQAAMLDALSALDPHDSPGEI